MSKKTKYIQLLGDLESVKYTEQSLTEGQQAQARTNIGTEIATDDEIIEMLAQEDMIPVVVDADGAILSDENGNILLW